MNFEIIFQKHKILDKLDLSKLPLPAIAHVVVNGSLNHYVVVLKVTNSFVTVMDPADGKIHKKILSEFIKEWTGVIVLMLPSNTFSKKDERISTYKRFWLLLKPHKLVLIQAFVGAIVYTLLGFSTSLFIQKLTDFVLINENYRLLNLLGTVMVLLLLVQVLIGVYKDKFLIKSGQQIDLQLILGYYKHLLKLPQQFFNTMRVGEIISRINDAVKIRTFINDISLNLMVDVLTIFFSFGLMFFFYWKLAIIMSLCIPLYFFVYLVLNRLNRRTERTVMEQNADLESQLVESLNSIETIKQFGMETHANAKTEIRFVQLLKTGYKSSLNSIFSITSGMFLTQIFTIVLLWKGSYYVIGKEITIGELLSFFAIIGYFTAPVSKLLQSNKEIQNALIAADRLFEIIDLEREKFENKVEIEKDKLGDIIFKNVSFTYNHSIQVLDQFNLNIPKGKVTSIVGESGSGKSTLINLIQKIYTIQDGNIYIGKLDLNYIENSSLRNIVGIVPQKIDLFSGSIIENIALGDYSPKMDLILEICTRLGIINFIEELPNGFNTHVGQNGSVLSGGQKQRIAIARALYKKPEILILDEATSSLDSKSESFIQNAVAILRQENKTILIIAHRLSTVINSDKIVVLKNGKILEEGAHETLYDNKNYYYDLWQAQLPKRNINLEYI
ncbi:peptidase domain-containing ABC transporter [Pseudotamlana carrageenivorans]|uniref:Peptidase C39 n=1 Tax=Pseudotamlana carrageenivorans TaxID=2069432 RepID=A0A2I7SJN8_9FLAO|nr:peptidase domain-containing ABC transporter [Tamlana carrageenivorans]AUS06113.1 peptidase C39 [Tamlana carrageenivorans]